MKTSAIQTNGKTEREDDAAQGVKHLPEVPDVGNGY